MTNQSNEMKESQVKNEEVQSFKDAPPDVQDKLNAEQEVAANVSGLFANRFYVFVSDEFVKISFLEIPSPESTAINPQASVVLKMKDARELHNLLGEMLRPERAGQIGTAR